MRTPLQRFAAKVKLPDSPNGCWLWRDHRNKDGYGQIKVGRKMVRSHRFAFLTFVGPVPPGLELDHLCRNPGCVNPAHLEPVTHRENTLRGVCPAAKNHRATTCRNGHPLSDHNLSLEPGRGGRQRRRCRACRSAATSLRLKRDANARKRKSQYIAKWAREKRARLKLAAAGWRINDAIRDELDDEPLP